MNRLPVLLLLLLGAAAVFNPVCGRAADKSVSYLPRQDVYIDEATGVRLPPVLGTYSKLKVTRNRNPVFGTRAAYVNEFGSCADIYIYRLDTASKAVDQSALEQDYAEVKKRLLALPQTTENPIRTVSVSKELSFTGRPQVKGALFVMDIHEEELFSSLTMFLCKGWIVKMRITYPMDVPEEIFAASQFTAAALKLFLPEEKTPPVPSVQPR